MQNFRTLYGYELRKILRRKMVWAATILLLLTALVSSFAYTFGDYVVDGKVIDSNYNQFLIDREYERALNGRAIDQTLLDEVTEGYGKIPKNADRYTLTEEYQTYARPYSAVFQFVRWMSSLTTSETMAWEMDYKEMYERHEAALEKDWSENRLTEAEKEYWREKEASLPHPQIFFYDEGYEQLLDMLYALAIPVFLYMTICLSGVFAEEHSRRTDQLLLCSRYGNRPLYYAKILAGLSFAAVSAALFSVILIGISLAVYGADGFFAAVQLLKPDYSGHLSAGEAVLIGYAVLTAACTLTAGIVMLLSELLRSSVGTLALVSAGIIATMFLKVPDQYRVLGQIWDYIPSNFTAVWNILNVRLIPVFGKLFQSWQVVPVLYLLLTAAAAGVGKVAYSRYQVKGR